MEIVIRHSSFLNNWAVETAATQTKPACAGFKTPSFSSFRQANFVGLAAISFSTGLKIKGYSTEHNITH
ncbi:MAG: hypothetical protein RLP97_15060 [Coleofasciculus chthonoplastes F2-STO-03]